MSVERVAVTTAPGRVAERLSRLLTEARLVPVPLPCIRVVAAPGDSIRRLRAAAERADWIVVTSRRAIDHVWPEGDIPAHPAVAAVGPRTAAAVREAGGRVEIVGSGGAAELRDLLAGRVAGRCVVFPHSRIADPETARWLRAEAAEVVAEPAYDTMPVPPGDDPVDAAVFGSPSAVAGWRLSRSFDGILCAAMGETTAAALARAGAPAGTVAERGFAELVGRLERSAR